LLDNLVV